MQILYASTLYPPAIGGAQIHLQCLATQMHGRGFDVSVVAHATRNRSDWLRMTTVFPDAAAEFDSDGVRVHRLGYSMSDRIAMVPWAVSYYATLGRSAAQIAGIVRRYLEPVASAADLIHVSRIGREFLASASLELAREKQVPLVLTPNHHPRWNGRRYQEYDRIYREADAVIALTSAERDVLVQEKQVPAERVHVTGIGPVLADDHDTGQFLKSHGLDRPYVLFLGQQLKYKGIAQLLDSAERVWKSHPDLQFVFAGPRSQFSKRLFSRVRDPRIRELGPLDIRDKTSALAGCELLCLPSAQESFGGVFVEAWAMNKAVIGGRIPPIAKVIEDGEDGILVQQDSDDIANAIIRLVGEPDLREAMAAAGHRKVTERYSWDRIASQLVNIYSSLGVSSPSHGQGSERNGSRPDSHTTPAAMTR